VDAFHPWAAFLMYHATVRPIFFGNLLKMRCDFGIMELEFNRSISEKKSIRAKIPFVKLNGKSEINMRAAGRTD
jgi:hypothetical protein